jgi:hypothetical protein
VTRLRALASTIHTRLMAVPNRILLVAGACFALNLASDLSNSFANAPRFGGPLVALGIFVAFLLMFALALLATIKGLRDTEDTKESRKAPLGSPAPFMRMGRGRGGGATPFDWRPWVIYPLALWTLWTGAQSLVVLAQQPAVLASPVNYGSDEMYYTHYNAWLVLHGQNPYVGERLSGALRYFRATSVTPLRAGAFDDPLHPPSKSQSAAIVGRYLADPAAPHPNLEPATTHSYPALSFLIAVPSVWLGLPTLGYLQVLGLIALIAALVALAPSQWRFAVLALCLLDVDGIRSVASSDFEIWTAAGIALVWLLRERPWFAAIVLGLICAVQQTAWFAAPFYLAWVVYRRGWRAAIGEAAAALGVFVAINLPWIILSPGAWLHSLVLPMTLPLFPTGGGLVGLGLGGALPLWPPAVYSVLEFAGYIALLAAYIRWLPRMPYAGVVLPSLVLLLAWRSPSRYFILLPFLAILALVLTWRQERADNRLDVIP